MLCEKVVCPHFVGAFNSRSKALYDSQVLILGLAYKANVYDMRQSLAFVLMDLLEQRGAEVTYCDPFIPSIFSSRVHARWTGTESVEWSADSLRRFDMAIVATKHAKVDHQTLLDAFPCVVDTRNALIGLSSSLGQVWKS